MAIYLNRDYLTQNTTTVSRRNVFGYILAIFMRRVLGYTYVGDTAFPINTNGSLLVATGDTTPTVTPTFPVGNRAGITNNGASIEVSIPLSVRGVYSSDIGRVLCLKSVLYPTRNSGCFVVAGIQQGNTTTIASGSNNVALPTGTINVASTTGFPASGSIFIGPNTSVAAGSTGLTLPQATINVASTTGFTATGSILITTSTGQQTVAYTGITGTTFTGCTGGTGVMTTGLPIISSNGIQTITYTGTTATTFTGCTGGAGTLITGEPIYNQNKLVIDYRTTAENPPTEAVDTVQWWLYDRDINCPAQGNNNTKTAAEYRGDGNSTTPRIILQSPHVLAWQVRICIETATDVANQAAPTVSTVPGFGGNSTGDFLTGGDHLHTSLYYNVSSNAYTGGTLGGSDNNGTTTIQHRLTFVGDDTGQSMAILGRRTGDVTGPNSYSIFFGLPDNEPVPAPLHNISRLFVIGSNDSFGSSGLSLNDISLSTGAGQSFTQGMTSSSLKAPISCSPCLWTYTTGPSQGGSPIFDAQAGDCPITSATELLPVDLLAGTVANWTSSGVAVLFPFEPRPMGILPIARIGRANFGNFTLTTDNATWNVSTATNATPIQITTTATNTLVTGQTVAINGVLGNTAANGTWVVTVINGTQFTLNGSVGNGAPTPTTGVVLRGSAFQHTRRGIYIPWNGPSVV